MHIWRIKSLTDEIKNGQLTEGGAFGYFFLATSFNCLSYFTVMLIGVKTPLATIPYGTVIVALDVAIIMAGLFISFRTFQRRGGHEFVQTFMCLLLPAGIRTFIFCLPLYVAAGIAMYHFLPENRHIAMAQTSAIIMTITLIVQFAIIYRNLLFLAPSQGQEDDIAAASDREET